MESFAYLYILLSLLSHYPPDLVDFIDPADYFQAHEVQVTPEKMQELVLAQPRDEAAQVAQLLALRWLADHPTAETKTVLAQVAERKPAGEMDRFAAEYARRALDKIAGKPFTAAPRTSLRDGLRWFPRDVTDGGGLDLTVSWANKPFAPKILQQFTGQSSLLSFLIDKQKLYDFADRAGNIRLERIVFGGYGPSPDGKRGERLYARFSGWANRRRLLDEICRTSEHCKVQEEEGNAGEEITSVLMDGGSACIMIGNTDLVVIADSDPAADLKAAIRELLDVRRGKQPNALQGKLAEDLKSIPDNAHGFVAGHLPASVAESARQGTNHFEVMPEHLTLSAVVGEDIRIRFEGRFKDAAAADKFAADLAAMKQEQAALLSQLAPDPSAALLLKVLQSVKLETKGASATGSAAVSRDAAEALGQVLDLSLEKALTAMVSVMFQGFAAFFRWLLIVTASIVVLLLIAGGSILFFLLRRRSRTRASGRACP